jgi:hypothetical protein
MESDLKRICDAIPATYDANISTQAHNILLKLTGDDVAFDINVGGEQPTISNPPINPNLQGYEILTYGVGGNTRMGGFAAGTYCTIKIDGNQIDRYQANSSSTNPHRTQVASYLNLGKTAEISYDRDLFKSITFTVPLVGTTPGYLHIDRRGGGSFKGLISLWWGTQSGEDHLIHVTGQTRGTNYAIAAYYDGEWHFRDAPLSILTGSTSLDTCYALLCLWDVTDSDNNNIASLFQQTEFTANDVVGLSRQRQHVYKYRSVFTDYYTDCLLYESNPDSPTAKAINASVIISPSGSIGTDDLYFQIPNSWEAMSTVSANVNYNVSMNVRAHLY